MQLFELHGWAVLQSDKGEDAWEADNDRMEKELRAALKKLDKSLRSLFQIHYPPNGMRSFSVSGLANHRRESIIDVYRWLAQRSGAAYGLLYVWDDEDNERGRDHEDVFRVFRLSGGELRELADPFLSPVSSSIIWPAWLRDPGMQRKANSNA